MFKCSDVLQVLQMPWKCPFGASSVCLKFLPVQVPRCSSTSSAQEPSSASSTYLLKCPIKLVRKNDDHFEKLITDQLEYHQYYWKHMVSLVKPLKLCMVTSQTENREQEPIILSVILSIYLYRLIIGPLLLTVASAIFPSLLNKKTSRAMLMIRLHIPTVKTLVLSLKI